MHRQTRMPINLLILVPHEDPARINPATAWPRLYLIPRLRLHLKKIIVLSMGKRYGGGSRIKRLLRRLFPSPEYDGNVEYHYSPMIFVPLFEFLQVPLALFYALVMLAVRRIKVDAIYCITIGEPYFAPVALLISSIYRLPLIMEHGDPFWEELRGFKQRAYLLYQKLIMKSKRTKYSIAVSPSIADFLARHFPNKRVLFIPEGYPSDFVGVSDSDKYLIKQIKQEYRLDNKKIVLYAGTISSPSIPINNLVDAASYVLRSQSDVLFIIFGRGAERLRPFIESKGLSQHFLLGFRPHNEIKLWISLADVCIHIRKSAVSPTKVYEYMILGKPAIIATEHPEKYTRLLINNVNCVITSLSPSEIAYNILRLLVDRELRERIGREGFMTIKKYSWDYFVEKLIWMLKSIAKNSSKIARE
ncbi:MAG: glycosyltransferase [Nitrososphaerota archaeon]